jgi:hypothetical protein
MRLTGNMRVVLGAATLLCGAAFYSPEATALTPNVCAANFSVAIAQKNAQMQTAMANCITSTAPGPTLAACLRATINTGNASLTSALTTIKSCLGAE